MTENLRKHDAGILKMGVLVVEEMSIPPRQSEFPIRGHCLDVCTEKVSVDGESNEKSKGITFHTGNTRRGNNHVCIDITYTR